MGSTHPAVAGRVFLLVEFRYMITFSFRTSILISINCVLLLVSISVMAADYDPAIIPPEAKYNIMDMTVHDNTRARDIPIRIYLPTVTVPSPVIVYSHGLGGSREGIKRNAMKLRGVST